MSDLIDDNAVPVVTDAPTEIWLCYGDIYETQSHSNLERNHHHILWCEDKQDVSDVRYVRADIAAERIAELEPQADAYNFACEDMEKFQRERFEAGKEVGTQGSLCDGMAWVYGRLNELESEVARLRVGRNIGVPTPVFDAALEAEAKRLYETWGELPGFVPWVDGGNSFRQDDARRTVRAMKGEVK